jgi:hypothetical protein
VAIPKHVVVDSDDSESSEAEGEYDYAEEDDEDDGLSGELPEEVSAVSADVGLLDIKTPMANQEGFIRSKSRDRNSFSSVGDKLASLPPDSTPFGLIAHLHSKTGRKKPDRTASEDNDLGVSGAHFFTPSPIGMCFRVSASMWGYLIYF